MDEVGEGTAVGEFTSEGGVEAKVSVAMEREDAEVGWYEGVGDRLEDELAQMFELMVVELESEAAKRSS